MRSFLSFDGARIAISIAITGVTITGSCAAVNFGSAGDKASTLRRLGGLPKPHPAIAHIADSRPTPPSQPFQMDPDGNENGLVHSSGGRSADATKRWQYCLAPSHAEHKVYISPPFPRNAVAGDAETAFARTLLQSEFRHDDVQCPIGSDPASTSSMRQHAIAFNREAGNAVVALNWNPSQPSAIHGDKKAPHPSSSEKDRSIGGWQYCFASSRSENKTYISPLFPRNAALNDTETAFGQMLSESNLGHDNAQCPSSNDVRSISNMRQQTAGSSQQAGFTIVALNWNPLKSLPPKANNWNALSSKRESSAPPSGWQYCLAPSHAEHKVYISPLFPKATALNNVETAFDRMLSRSRVRYDDVQCPNGNDELSTSRMRQHAISFNQGAGNRIIALDWKP